MNDNIYKNWLIPAFKRNKEWNEYIEALTKEINDLTIYNTGVYNNVGFHGIAENLKLFGEENGWLIKKSFTNKYTYGEDLEWEVIGDATTQLRAFVNGDGDYELDYLGGTNVNFDFYHFHIGSLINIIVDNIDSDITGVHKVKNIGTNKLIFDNPAGGSFDETFVLGSDIMQKLIYVFIPNVVNVEECVVYPLQNYDRYFVLPYQFYIGKSYRIIFDVENGSGSFNIHLSLGGVEQIINVQHLENQHFDVTLVAQNYYCEISIVGASGTGYAVLTNFRILGVLDKLDEINQKLILTKLIDYNEASREILDMYRASIDFPYVEGLTDDLLRLVVENYKNFVPFIGSEVGSLVLFYMLGYEVSVKDLYAHHGDYNRLFYSYQEQVDSGVLTSSVGGIVGVVSSANVSNRINILNPVGIKIGDWIENDSNPFSQRLVYVIGIKKNHIIVSDVVVTQLNDTIKKYNLVGMVSQGGYGVNCIYLNQGHNVVIGDKLVNQDHPFLVQVVVTKVEGVKVYLNVVVDVYLNDVLTVYRKYEYAVNPDPVNLFKTPHINVFFKKKFIDSITIIFEHLSEIFYKYLPANVVIDFFGYSTTIQAEQFAINETKFNLKFKNSESFEMVEVTTMPSDDKCFVVHALLPVTGQDIYGTPCDIYSYVKTNYLGIVVNVVI